MTTCLQQQAEWISDCIKYVNESGKRVIEASESAQEAWVSHHDEVAEQTLVTKTSSWYMGSNGTANQDDYYRISGVVGNYREKCLDVAKSQYSGFTIS